MDGIQIRALKKWYGDTHALDGLDLDAAEGEILGVAGPNGAGKSTLIRILAGETTQDSGDVVLDGAPWSPTTARHRVAVVHQEPQVFPNLTVRENLLVGHERWRLGQPVANPQDADLLNDLAIAQFANWPLGSCTLAVQQKAEIARALAQDARVFLFDEPNSALTDEESDDLFRHMHQLADDGRVVILVSHRLAELVAHAGRVAVIRDGRCRVVLEGSRVSQEAIARELVLGQPIHDTATGDRVLEAAARAGSAVTVKNWSHPEGAFEAITLDVRHGEILAFVGVEGSGARELTRSLAGFEHGTGSIQIAGRPEGEGVRFATAYVSADRRGSLFLNFGVHENVVSRLGVPLIAGTSGLLNRRRMIKLATELVSRFLIKVSSVTQPIGSLSGGNQQKVAIAAAVARQPRLLVLEEPTRGVDVGSKREIYRILREFAADGHSLVIFCTEVPEVFEVADRLHVVSDGRLSPAVAVATFPDLESLASEISRLEQHGGSGEAA
jgi:ABC-type sugar transport system ATPase subunit